MSEGNVVEAPAVGVRKQMDDAMEMIRRLVSLNDTHTRAALTLMERHKLQHRDITELATIMGTYHKAMVEDITMLKRRVEYVEDRLMLIEQKLGLLE
jgi:hypothetical protein